MLSNQQLVKIGLTNEYVMENKPGLKWDFIFIMTKYRLSTKSPSPAWLFLWSI